MASGREREGPLQVSSSTAITELTVISRSAENNAVRLSLCENLLRELLPLQDNIGQQAIQNVLTEVNSPA
jgi:hypothetical protein